MALTREQVQNALHACEMSQGFDWTHDQDLPDDWWFAKSLEESRNLMPQLAEEWKQQKDDIKQKDAENRRLRENILPKIARCVEAIEYFMGGPWNCDGPTSVGNAFHIHECIRDIRQALADIGAGSGADIDADIDAGSEADAEDGDV